MTTPRSITKLGDKYYTQTMVTTLPTTGSGVEFHGTTYPLVFLKNVDQTSAGFITDDLSSYGLVRLSNGLIYNYNYIVPESGDYGYSFTISLSEIVSASMIQAGDSNEFIFAKTTGQAAVFDNHEPGDNDGAALIPETRILAPVYPEFSDSLTQYSMAYAPLQGDYAGCYYFTGYQANDNTVSVYVTSFNELGSTDGYELFKFDDGAERNLFQNDYVRYDDDYFYFPSSEGIGLVRARRDGLQADKWHFVFDDPYIHTEASYCLGASDTHFFFLADQYDPQEDSNAAIIVKIDYAATSYEVIWIADLEGSIVSLTFDPSLNRLLLSTLVFDLENNEFVSQISSLTVAVETGLYDEDDTLDCFAVSSFSSITGYGAVGYTEESDRVRSRIRNDRRITKIILRRGHGIDLPGKPRNIHPKIWNRPLEEAEVAFSNDEGRLFVGANTNMGLPQATRMAYPYQNIEIIGENSAEVFAAIHGQRMKNGDSRDYFTSTLLRKGAVTGAISSIVRIFCAAVSEE